VATVPDNIPLLVANNLTSTGQVCSIYDCSTTGTIVITIYAGALGTVISPSWIAATRVG